MYACAVKRHRLPEPAYVLIFLDIHMYIYTNVHIMTALDILACP